jgi:hypothetical protein
LREKDEVDEAGGRMPGIAGEGREARRPSAFVGGCHEGEGRRGDEGAWQERERERERESRRHINSSREILERVWGWRRGVRTRLTRAGARGQGVDADARLLIE